MMYVINALNTYIISAPPFVKLHFKPFTNRRALPLFV